MNYATCSQALKKSTEAEETERAQPCRDMPLAFLLTSCSAVRLFVFLFCRLARPRHLQCFPRFSASSAGMIEASEDCWPEGAVRAKPCGSAHFASPPVVCCRPATIPLSAGRFQPYVSEDVGCPTTRHAERAGVTQVCMCRGVGAWLVWASWWWRRRIPRLPASQRRVVAAPCPSWSQSALEFELHSQAAGRWPCREEGPGPPGALCTRSGRDLLSLKFKRCFFELRHFDTCSQVGVYMAMQPDASELRQIFAHVLRCAQMCSDVLSGRC